MGPSEGTSWGAWWRRSSQGPADPREGRSCGQARAQDGVPGRGLLCGPGQPRYWLVPSTRSPVFFRGGSGGRAGAPLPGQACERHAEPWVVVPGPLLAPQPLQAPPSFSPRLALAPQVPLPLLPARPRLHPSSGQRQHRVLCVQGRLASASAKWPFYLPSLRPQFPRALGLGRRREERRKTGSCGPRGGGHLSAPAVGERVCARGACGTCVQGVCVCVLWVRLTCAPVTLVWTGCGVLGGPICPCPSTQQGSWLAVPGGVVSLARCLGGPRGRQPGRSPVHTAPGPAVCTAQASGAALRARAVGASPAVWPCARPAGRAWPWEQLSGREA